MHLAKIYMVQTFKQWNCVQNSSVSVAKCVYALVYHAWGDGFAPVHGGSSDINVSDRQVSNAELNTRQSITHTHTRTHARTHIHTHTHMHTWYTIIQQMVASTWLGDHWNWPSMYTNSIPCYTWHVKYVTYLLYILVPPNQPVDNKNRPLEAPQVMPWSFMHTKTPANFSFQINRFVKCRSKTFQ